MIGCQLLPRLHYTVNTPLVGLQLCLKGLVLLQLGFQVSGVLRQGGRERKRERECLTLQPALPPLTLPCRTHPQPLCSSPQSSWWPPQRPSETAAGREKPPVESGESWPAAGARCGGLGSEERGREGEEGSDTWRRAMVRSTAKYSVL